MNVPITITKTVTTGADTRVEVALVEPTNHGGLPQLEIRLLRRTAAGGFEVTPCGFRVGLHLAGHLVDAIRTVALRGCEHAIAAPLVVTERKAPA